MDTHEHLIPDEDLPGAGIFDADFIRKGLAESERDGLLLWDEEKGTYRESARATVGRIVMQLMHVATTIDPGAGPAEVMAAVAEAVPWQVGVEVREDSDDEAELRAAIADAPPWQDPAELPELPELELPSDTFPEGWLQDAA